MAHICVLGAGGWGTALAIMSVRAGNQVTLWSCFPEEIATLRRDREHKKLLPGVLLPDALNLTDDLSCVRDADLVIMVVPSFAVDETSKKLRAYLPDGALLANAAKGLDEASGRRLSEVIHANLPAAQIVVLSGPSHAEEVARALPTTVVSASESLEAAERVQELLMNPTFRIYVNQDVVGVELGGALKNVIALAAGICDGLQMGDNTKAALMTRGIAEMARLGTALGGHTETFAGLSGIGDLIVTCGSMFSRNRRAGILIGQGKTPKEAIAEVGTVEGYFATANAWKLAQKCGVEMPILEQCYRVCYQGQDIRAAIGSLMERPRRAEGEAMWTAQNR